MLKSQIRRGCPPGADRESRYVRHACSKPAYSRLGIGRAEGRSPSASILISPKNGGPRGLKTSVEQIAAPSSPVARRMARNDTSVIWGISPSPNPLPSRERDSIVCYGACRGAEPLCVNRNIPQEWGTKGVENRVIRQRVARFLDSRLRGNDRTGAGEASCRGFGGVPHYPNPSPQEWGTQGVENE